jgi:hypothetical protein
MEESFRDFMEKYNFPEEACNSIGYIHEDMEYNPSIHFELNLVVYVYFKYKSCIIEMDVGGYIISYDEDNYIRIAD